MTASKSERLMNLVIMLLVARSPVTKDRIRDVIEGYQGSTPDAFEKMFERDKAELRALGIPLELAAIDKFFDDELGYRIARDSFELPELDLEPDELAVLGLAARVWEHAGLAATTSQALVKLRAAGYDVDREALDVLQPRVVADDPAFDTVLAFTTSRTPITFAYKRPADSTSTRRHLEPWAVVTSRERWYVVGLDTDRREPRMFRLSRIVGEVEKNGAPGSFVVPAGTDIRALTSNLTPSRPTQEATVLAHQGRAVLLRRRATRVEFGVPGPDGTTSWDRLVVPMYSTWDFAGDIASHLGEVVAEAPAELREHVLARLTSVAGESA
ncbi:MAG: WYL domain-containing protein [Propionibacteriales bacterium]|nr:WYL domain-containing protein [Propionibacteriales bacterium]